MLHKWGSNLIVHDYLAAAYTDLGEHVKGCDHQLEALKFDPNSFNRHYNLGCAYMSLGQVADARACFRRAVELNPVCADAFFNLALVTNDPALVAQYLRQGTLINPHDGDMQESLTAWEQLIAEPEFSMAEYRIAMAMKAQSEREYNVARRELAMALEEALHGELQQAACLCQAEIARGEQDLRASVAALEEAVQLGPVEPFVWNNIAARLLLLVQQEDFPVAERATALQRVDETARQASALSDYSRPHQNRALSLFLLGSLSEAAHEVKLAENMAQRQIAAGARGERVCLGCPTEGQMPEECQACLRRVHGLAQDIDLAKGNYHL
jgi:tetratricopeptide (TPR) repeat protein